MYKNISIEQVLYHIYKKTNQSDLSFLDNTSNSNHRYKFPSVVSVAKMSNRILKNERLRVAKEVGEVFGYELVPRIKITNWKYRNNKLKYKVNGKAYAYVPQTIIKSGPTKLLSQKVPRSLDKDCGNVKI